MEAGIGVFSVRSVVEGIVWSGEHGAFIDQVDSGRGKNMKCYAATDR